MAVDTPAPMVTVAAVVAAAGVAASGGLFGGVPVGAPDSVAAIPILLAPAGPAFLIWTVIYLGMAALTVWSWTSRGRASTRSRSVLWWVVASFVLNAAWIAATVAGVVWASTVIIVALLVVLVVVNRTLDRTVPRDHAENILLDGTMGLYAGWVSVAAVANVMQLAVQIGSPAEGIGPTVLSVVLIAALVGWARLAIPRVRNFQSVLVGLMWGLAWVAVARFTGPLPSLPVAVAAAVAVVAIVILWIVRDRDVPARLNRPASTA